jgi:hypothetical protein
MAVDRDRRGGGGRGKVRVFWLSLSLARSLDLSLSLSLSLKHQLLPGKLGNSYNLKYSRMDYYHRYKVYCLDDIIYPNRHQEAPLRLDATPLRNQSPPSHHAAMTLRTPLPPHTHTHIAFATCQRGCRLSSIGSHEHCVSHVSHT